MLGQHTNRVHEIEFIGLEFMCQEIAFDERQPLWDQRDSAGRAAGSIEHGRGDVDPDEAPHVTEGMEISARAASEIERVDRSFETVAHRLKPVAQPPNRVRH